MSEGVSIGSLNGKQLLEAVDSRPRAHMDGTPLSLVFLDIPETDLPRMYERDPFQIDDHTAQALIEIYSEMEQPGETRQTPYRLYFFTRLDRRSISLVGAMKYYRAK